jgi:hypothetical protein
MYVQCKYIYTAPLVSLLGYRSDPFAEPYLLKKYREPFEINSAGLLVLGGLWWYLLSSNGSSGSFLWLVALLGLPLMNALYCISYVLKGPRHLALVYGLLTVAFVAVDWIMWWLTIPAMTSKIGG